MRSPGHPLWSIAMLTRELHIQLLKRYILKYNSPAWDYYFCKVDGCKLDVGIFLSVQVAPLCWCKAPDVGILRPDRVFYLELSAVAAEKRAIYGEERYEKVSFQQQVEEQYQKLKEEEWLTFDASKNIDTLHAEILKEALEVVDASTKLPIGNLWTKLLEDS